jgi:hypothetical protein
MSADYVTAMIIVSLVSILASSVVIFTPIIFPSMRYRLFMQIITFMSIGDVIGNFTYMFPYRPTSGNWWCDVQAFTSFVGYPVEWLWTVILVYFLYTLAVTGEVPKSTWKFHLLSWTLPVILALCALFTSKYTHSGQVADVCSINTTHAATIYHIVVFYGLLIICFAVMLFLFLSLCWHEFYLHDIKTDSITLGVAKRALVIYPCLMFFFWLPHGISATISLKQDARNVYDVLLMWKTLHGLAVALVFFGQSEEARRVWYHFITIDCFRFQPNQRVDSRFSTASNSSAMVDVLGNTSVDMTASPLMIGKGGTTGGNDTGFFTNLRNSFAGSPITTGMFFQSAKSSSAPSTDPRAISADILMRTNTHTSTSTNPLNSSVPGERFSEAEMVATTPV